MATIPASSKISFDEYLELERAAQFKSEYRSVEVFAMSGGRRFTHDFRSA